MTPAQLFRTLASVEPALRRAILAQLIEWQKLGKSAQLAIVAAAIEANDTTRVVSLMLGPEVARAVEHAPLPPAVKAFSNTTQVEQVAVTRAEKALVKATAKTVVDVSRVARATVPVAPARTLPPRIVVPDAPSIGVLTVRHSLPVPSPVVAPIVRSANADAAVAYGGDALKYLRSEARAGIIAAVRQGNAAGINPRDVARGLRDTVGLGETQAVWVANLRAELEAGQFATALGRKLVKGPIRQTIAARRRSKKPLTPAEIDKIVGAYGDKWRAFHAETIARTLSLDLLRTAALAEARRAQQSGKYGNAPMTKRWVAIIDKHTRDAHRALNGSTIDLNAQWNDDGELRDVPGGYNCRCAMVIHVGVNTAGRTSQPPALDTTT